MSEAVYSDGGQQATPSNNTLPSGRRCWVGLNHNTLCHFYSLKVTSVPGSDYSTTCLESTLKATPNVYFISEVPSICTD